MACTRFYNWEITQERSQLVLSFLYATRLLNVLYLMVKYHENNLSGFRVMGRTRFNNYGK